MQQACTLRQTRKLVGSSSWGPRRCRAPSTQRSLRVLGPAPFRQEHQAGGRGDGAARADSSVPVPSGEIGEVPRARKSLSGLGVRVLAGTLLGAIGASLIIAGGVPYLIWMEFFVYQSIREYFGFVSAVGVREGRKPPPSWATSLVTLCCMSLPLYTFVTAGKIAVALAIASFVMCSVLVLTSKEPKLSTLTSTIFGLLYCGARCMTDEQSAVCPLFDRQRLRTCAPCMPRCSPRCAASLKCAHPCPLLRRLSARRPLHCPDMSPAAASANAEQP